MLINCLHYQYDFQSMAGYWQLSLGSVKSFMQISGFARGQHPQSQHCSKVNCTYNHWVTKTKDIWTYYRLPFLKTSEIINVHTTIRSILTRYHINSFLMMKCLEFSGICYLIEHIISHTCVNMNQLLSSLII